MGNMLSLIATCFGGQRKQPPRANLPANAPPRRHSRTKMKSRVNQGSTTAPPGSHPSVTQPLLPTNTPQKHYSPITMDGALLNTQSPLLKASIPTEIHLAIVKHLPLSAVVALTLTCKRFLNIVGTRKSWEQLRNNHSERSVFYSLLERDLVDYYHRLPADTQLSKRLAISTPRDFKLWHYPRDLIYAALAERFGYAIAWSHLVLAFKCGGGGIALEGFHLDTTKPLAPEAGSGVRSCSVNLVVTPKIVAGRLLLGCKYRISRDTLLARPGKVPIEELKQFKLRLCRHVATEYERSPWYCTSLSSKLSPRPHNFRTDYRSNHYRRDPYDTSDNESDVEIEDFFALGEQSEPSIPSTITGQCSFCMTEYSVTSSKEDGTICINTWQDLGPRRPRHPADDSVGPVFRAIAGTSKPEDCKILAYKAGSVRAAYETDDGSEMVKADRKL